MSNPFRRLLNAFGANLRSQKDRVSDEEQGQNSGNAEDKTGSRGGSPPTAARWAFPEGPGAVFWVSSSGRYATSERDAEEKGWPGIRWAHLQSYNMDLDALQGVPGINKAVVSRIVDGIHRTHEMNFVHGKYLEPLAIDREHQHSERWDEFAAFFCCPYLACFTGQSSLPRTSPLHPTRTLLQSRYRLESTEHRDENQVIRKLDLDSGGGLIHVPQVWCLMVDLDTIVTCAPCSLAELVGEPVQRGDGTWGLTHEKVDVGLILNLVLEGVLRDIKVDKEMQLGIADMYNAYASKLAFRVREQASRSMLQDINALAEELDIIHDILTKQGRHLEDCSKLLSQYRILGAHETWHEIFERLSTSIAMKLKDFQELKSRAAQLAVQTAQLAELKQEDHGTAILVFTVVTIIFLPLSFVATFLGMNTTDIRNMQSKQAMFWEVAVPLTLCISLVALVAAFRGRRVLESLRGVRR